LPPAIDSKQVEIWFQDEARVGQRGTTSRIWAPKGTRPRIVQQQQFISAYLFGAVCPAKKKGAGIVMPKANTEAMQHHLEVISVTVEKNCHALIVTDGAAWHSTSKLLIPKNITLLVLGVIKMGNQALSSWAENGVISAVEKQYQETPKAHRKGKKTSAGTAPLEKSQ